MKRDMTRSRQLASMKYSAYRTFFETEEGQLILTDLMKACCFLDTTVAESAELTYFNEGKRAVLLQIFRTSKLTQKEVSELVNRMFLEQNEDFF
jgi:hypothetical protein